MQFVWTYKHMLLGPLPCRKTPPAMDVPHSLEEWQSLEHRPLVIWSHRSLFMSYCPDCITEHRSSTLPTTAKYITGSTTVQPGLPQWAFPSLSVTLSLNILQFIMSRLKDWKNVLTALDSWGDRNLAENRHVWFFLALSVLCNCSTHTMIQEMMMGPQRGPPKDAWLPPGSPFPTLVPLQPLVWLWRPSGPGTGKRPLHTNVFSSLFFLFGACRNHLRQEEIHLEHPFIWNTIGRMGDGQFG